MSGCVILMYHVVDVPRSDSEARFCCPPRAFRDQMRVLAQEEWKVIPLAELVRAVSEGRSPPERSVVITFDDGTACTHEAALPILAGFGLTATVFAVSHLLGGRNEWMVRESQPERTMLSARQLRELTEAGFDVGSHSAHHVRLADLPAAQAANELRDSKARLEDALGQQVNHLAYPYGSHSAAVRTLAREAGYEGACTTRWGKNGAGSDRYALRRIEIMGDDGLWAFRLKLRSGTHDMPPWSWARAKLKELVAAR